jgi:hypothetical protein
MTNKEEPEKLLEIFDCQFWDSKKEMVKDVKDKLIEFGYYTNDSICPNTILQKRSIKRTLIRNERKISRRNNFY